MSKGKRNRGHRNDPRWKEGPDDSAAAMRALDPNVHLDPKMGVQRVPAREDGKPPPNLVAEFIADAKAQGCVCRAEVVVHRSAEGGGAIALMHEDHCPLIRVLDEQTP